MNARTMIHTGMDCRAVGRLLSWALLPADVTAKIHAADHNLVLLCGAAGEYRVRAARQLARSAVPHMPVTLFASVAGVAAGHVVIVDNIDDLDSGSLARLLALARQQQIVLIGIAGTDTNATLAREFQYGGIWPISEEDLCLCI
jgi:hypothetical protein